SRSKWPIFWSKPCTKSKATRNRLAKSAQLLQQPSQSHGTFRPGAMAGCGVDVTCFAGVDERCPPGERQLAGIIITTIGIASACDQQGRKRKWIARKRNEARVDGGDAGDRLLTSRRDEECAYNTTCLQLCEGMGHRRHAAAVGDEHDGFAGATDGLDQARSPGGAVGSLPIVLLHSSRRFEPRLPTCLPVIRSRIGPAWNHKNLDVDRAHD